MQLVRFLAIAETGSFRAAAARLNISQPTLTWSIQQLEQALGVEVLERGAGGTKLTHLGNLLLPRAKLITSEASRALDEFEGIKAQRLANLTAGVAPMFAASLFPAATAATMRKFPDLTLRIIEGHSADLIAALQTGDIDLAFGGKPADADTEGVRFEPIHEQQYLLVARADHPIFKSRHISDECSIKHPWVMFDGVRFVSLEQKVFLAKGLPAPRIAVRSSSMPYIKALVLRSDHIGYLALDYVEDELRSGLVREVPNSIMKYTATAGILTRQAGAQTPAMKALKTELRAACAAPRKTFKSNAKGARIS